MLMSFFHIFLVTVYKSNFLKKIMSNQINENFNIKRKVPKKHDKD